MKCNSESSGLKPIRSSLVNNEADADGPCVAVHAASPNGNPSALLSELARPNASTRSTYETRPVTPSGTEHTAAVDEQARAFERALVAVEQLPLGERADALRPVCRSLSELDERIRGDCKRALFDVIRWLDPADQHRLLEILIEHGKN